MFAIHRYLKGTGILDAYQHVMQKLTNEGWPQDKSLFDHAAYELLKWRSDNKDFEFSARPLSNASVYDKDTTRSIKDPTIGHVD